jgi:hypothetical protein
MAEMSFTSRLSFFGVSVHEALVGIWVTTLTHTFRCDESAVRTCEDAPHMKLAGLEFVIPFQAFNPSSNQG